MVGVNKVLTARCRWNGTSSFPAECQNSDSCVGNRCWSHGVRRDNATSTVVHLNDYISECDSGFELKSTARVAIDNVDHVPQTPYISSRKLSPTSVMCSAWRVSSVTAESRRGICRTTSGARSREQPPAGRQHQLSRRPCTSSVQLEEELKL